MTRLSFQFSISVLNVLLLSCVLPTICAALPSSPPAVAQIAETVSESVRVQLTDNTNAAVVSGSDMGVVADDFPMSHMLLQLQRSAEREQALEKFIDELHTPGSVNFHHWLTAEQFGTLYGPAQQDIALVVSWLQAHDFTVNTVYPSGMTIDFSGTARQVQQAFGTEIHNYIVQKLDNSTVTYFSNMRDPSIPAALARVVVGVVSLNNYFAQPHLRKLSKLRAAREQGIAKLRPRSAFTFAGTPNEYDVAPADFNTIYNIAPVWGSGIRGAGQTIVVVEDTNMQSVDWTTFRTAFSLNTYAGTFSQTHPAPPTGTNNCTNPGTNDAEGEAALDAEWASVAAPDATIVLASCTDTTTFGGLIAAQNLLNGASPPSIISVSYGQCESSLGSTQNAAFNSAWQQAVTEGTTVLVSSGDEGAASCDADQPYARHGIAVSGFASTPYNVAVGGTDFSDFVNASTSTYWNATNGAGDGSAKSYVPEIPWNDSCASSTLYAFVSTRDGTTFSNGVAFCNNTTGSPDPGSDFVTTASGSGGPSSKYDKPAWQAGVVGIVNDGHRDLPDVSLFAANGLYNHALLFCMSDAAQGGATCDYTNATDLQANSAGGTSFSTPAFAGIQALINQVSGDNQGNMNVWFYQIAGQEYGNSGTLTSCNASNGNAVGSNCVFRDITSGDIDVPCRKASTNCYTTTASTSSNCGGTGTTKGCGILSTSTSTSQPAYPATQGWDFATGLGSVNVANLVAVFTPSTLSFTAEPASQTAGQTLSTITVSVANSLNEVDAKLNSGHVTLTLSGGITLNGTLTQSIVNGVATFSNLSINHAGTYTLTAATNEAGISSMGSTSFTINPAMAAQVIFSTEPTSATAGAVISPTVTVQLQDSLGNVETTDSSSTITLTAHGPGSIAAGGSVTISNGIATFGSLVLHTAGSYTLTAASSLGPSSVNSSGFTINPAAASQLVFTGQPADLTAGATLGTIGITEEDTYGNSIDDNASNASFTLPACGGTVGLGSVMLVGGVGTLDSAQRFYTVNNGGLQITASTGTFHNLSQSFIVSANSDLIFADGLESCRL